MREQQPIHFLSQQGRQSLSQNLVFHWRRKTAPRAAHFVASLSRQATNAPAAFIHRCRVMTAQGRSVSHSLAIVAVPVCGQAQSPPRVTKGDAQKVVAIISVCRFLDRSPEAHPSVRHIRGTSEDTSRKPGPNSHGGDERRSHQVNRRSRSIVPGLCNGVNRYGPFVTLPNMAGSLDKFFENIRLV